MVRLFMIKALVLLCACDSVVTHGDETRAIRKRIGQLIKDGQFETAAAYLQRELPAAEEQGVLRVQMSCIEIKRARFRQAFECFWKAINASRDPVAPQSRRDPAIEKLLNISSLMRTHQAFPVASTMQRALRNEYPDCASVLYETANLHLVENAFCDFFECFYEAYEKDPANLRALPGLAAIRAVAAPQAPEPNDFPWLAAAVAFYDNPKIWQNVFLTLDRSQLHEKEEIDAFAETLPDHVRPIFCYYHYRHTNRARLAETALAGLDLFVTEDFRLRLCRYHILVSEGLAADSLAGFQIDPRDPYERLLFHDLWISDHERSQWREPDFTNAYDDFLSALTEITRSLLGPDEITANRDYLLGRWATNMATKQSVRQAVRLLERHRDDLSDTNMSLLAGLYLSLNEFQQALRVMEGSTEVSVDEPETRTIQAIMDYALLSDDVETFQRCLSNARRRQMDPIVREYANLSHSLERPKDDDHRALPVSGCASFEAEDWRRWGKLGPCAYTSTLSVLEYWNRHVPYSDVKDALNQLAAESPGSSLPRLASYLQNKDLVATFIAPTPTVATQLLSHGIPIILVGTRFGEGIFFGHMSVVYAHDDRVQKLFLKESLDIMQERRLPYDSLFGETVFLAVVPRGSPVERYVAELELFEVPAWGEPLSGERVRKLAQKDPLLAWWAHRYNGDILYRQQDAKCVAHYEKCLAIREPLKACFYRRLAEACLTHGDESKAVGYMQRALAMEPRSLELLALSIQVNAGSLGEDYKADAAQTERLLEITRTMEEVNPDYPLTYFLRGDVYARGFRMQRKQETLTAFQRFLAKYEAMNELWKRAHVPHRDHARRTVQLCRKALAGTSE